MKNGKCSGDLGMENYNKDTTLVPIVIATEGLLVWIRKPYNFIWIRSR